MYIRWTNVTLELLRVITPPFKHYVPVLPLDICFYVAFSLQPGGRPSIETDEPGSLGERHVEVAGDHWLPAYGLDELYSNLSTRTSRRNCTGLRHT